MVEEISKKIQLLRAVAILLIGFMLIVLAYIIATSIMAILTFQMVGILLIFIILLALSYGVGMGFKKEINEMIK